MNHFYKCKDIIKEKHSVEEFRKYLDEFLSQTLKDKEDELLSVLLKDIIVTPQHDFRAFFDALMEKGANVNFVDKKCLKSLLMTACENGSVQTVKQLLSKDVNTEHKDLQNKTCLFYALENKRKTEALEILSLILKVNPALVNIKAGNNRSILMAATEKEKSDYVRLILSQGANPNQATLDTLDTSLHKIVRNLGIEKRNLVLNQRKQIIRLLLQHGADPGLRNKQGKTPGQLQPLLVDIINTVKTTARAESNSENNRFLHREEPKIKKEEAGLQNPKAQVHIQKGHQQRYRQKTPNESYNRIQKLKDQILDLEKEIQQVKWIPPKALEAIPIHCLYIKENELQSYLDQQIAQFVSTMEEQKQKVKPTVDRVVQHIKIKLSLLNARVVLFGSQSTQLSFAESDVNIAICPNDPEIKSPDRIKLMTNVEILIKQIKGLTEVKNIRQMSIIKAIYQEGTNKIAVNIQMANVNIQQQSVTLIKKYLSLYSEIKPLNYIVRTMLRNAKALGNIGGGLCSYGLLVLICSYVKTKHQLQGIPIFGMGEVLIGFLNTFGFAFDYIDKGIYLYAEKEFSYSLNMKYVMQSRLVISDPLNENNDIGASPHYTKFMQHLFKLSYLSLKINGNCNLMCPSKTRIKTGTAKRSGIYQPCCILERMFKCQTLLG